MPGLPRFSDEEIKRMTFEEEKVSSIAQIINSDRSSDRLCTSRGVRTCLKRSSASVKSVSSKLVYKSIHLDLLHLLLSTLRLVLIARLVEDNYKCVCRKNYTLTFQSA